MKINAISRLHKVKKLVDVYIYIFFFSYICLGFIMTMLSKHITIYCV